MFSSNVIAVVKQRMNKIKRFCKKQTIFVTDYQTPNEMTPQCGNLRILRENNFGDFRSSKTAVFAIFETANFTDLVNFKLQKVKKISIQHL